MKVTQADVAKAIINHPITAGIAVRTKVHFLPITLTMRMQNVTLKAAPRFRMHVTHVASGNDKGTGLSSCSKRGNDGDVQPKRRPYDIMAKQPGEIEHLHCIGG